MEKLFKTKLVDTKMMKTNNLFFLVIISFLLLSCFILKTDFSGTIGLIFVLLLTYYFSSKYKFLTTILYVSLFVRLITIFLGNNFIVLPDSWGDATLFELKAWEWSQDGFLSVFNNYPTKESSFFISWILAFFYSLADRSVILGQSLSLIFGISSILLASLIAKKIWNESISLKLGWILALYPTLILYSCLILREAYVWFFLLMAIYGIVCWCEDRKFKSLIISFVGFYVATLFHGGMIIGALIFLFIIGLISILDFSKKIINLRVSRNYFIIMILSVLSLVYLAFIADSIPKINSLKNLLDFEKILTVISKKNIHSAAYPEWTIPTTSFELFYKSPIRIIYFVFSPFPWDVSKINHIMGLFDGTFHIILFILLIKNFKKIWKDKTLRIIFIIFLSYIIFYGIPTGNFGTGIRHRAKFIFLFILLVLPWIPKFSLNKKNYKL